MKLMSSNYYVSTNKDKLDIPMIHDFLSNVAYWSKGVPLYRVEKAIEHSLTFGVYHENTQVGFARVISDYSTIAYLGDVFILPEYRGKGLSKMLMKEIMGHAELQGMRRWILLTGNAHGLYEQYGWTSLSNTDIYMEKYDAECYD